MKRFLEKLRTVLRRIFFWHQETPSAEFTPPMSHDHALVLQVTESKALPRWKQMRYAGLVLNWRERRTLIITIALFLIACGGIALAALHDHVVRVAAPGGKIVEAVVGSPKAINPLYAPTNDPDADLSALIFSGLFHRANGTDIVPDLAEGYEWSPDGKKLTITIRGDALFQDGTPLSADDVFFTLRAAKNPAWHSPYAPALQNVDIEEPDAHTIQLTLASPNINILDTLTIGILPAHIWSDVEPQNALLADANSSPVGSGPFSMRSIRRNANGNIVSYTLDRFSNYYGVQPFLNQIEIRFFPDRGTAEDALRGGQADQLAFESGAQADKLTKSSQLRMTSLELPQLTMALLNTNDPLLKDIAVRRALALAVNRDDIVNAQSGHAHPATSPYPFIEPTRSASSTEESLDAARALLQNDGWKASDNGGIRMRKTATSSTQGEPLALQIAVPDVPELTSVADALKRQWSLIGADVIIHTQRPDDMIAHLSDLHNAQIVVWNVLLPSTQDISPIWLSAAATDSGLNLSNLKNRDVDSALQAIPSATSIDALAKARTAVANAILAQTPAVFLTRPSYEYVRSSRIMGATDDLRIATPSDRFFDVQKWYVNTAWRLK